MSCAAPSRKYIYRATQAGFSFVELAIVLVIAGLLSWAAFSGYETVSAQQEIERGRAQAQQLQSVIRAFALRHGRLPCPGSTPDGYESLTAGNCTDGNQKGWFPYISVGLELPIEKLRSRYSVLRIPDISAAQDADLAVAKERTGDVPADATFLDTTDLVVALNNATIPALATTRTYLTGDAGAAGDINCISNPVMAAAYWIVIPLEDKDGDGNRLDAPHTTNSLCAASPSAPLRFGSDDVVIAESPGQLAGWLRKNMP